MGRKYYEDGRRLLRIDKEYLRQSALHHGPVIVDGATSGSDPTTLTTTTTTTTMSSSQQHDHHTKDEPHHDNDELQYFLRDIVKPYFSLYLDLPQPIPLSWSFLHRLRTTTLLAQPCPIPKSRQSSWESGTKHNKTDSYNQQQQQQQYPFGWLLWDYRKSTCMMRRQCDSYSSSSNNNNNNNSPNGIGTSVSSDGWCISVELKPKAGYLPSTPLVDPKHRAKYMQSRFVLLQELDRVGYGQEIQRGWKSSPHHHHHRHHENHNNHHRPEDESVRGNRSSHASNYDPLDLFSGNDPIRVERALRSLWECPQNNFKLWLTPPAAPRKSCDHHDGTSTYPEPVLVVADDHYFVIAESGATEKRQELLEQFVSTILAGTDAFLLPDNDHGSHVISSKEQILQFILNYLLTCVLLAEQTFLQKIRLWQQLDVLDGDGAVLVYQRLVELCDGSHTQAQRLLDEAYPTQPAFDASSSRRNNQDDAASRQHPHAAVLTACFPESPLAFPAESACCPAFIALCQEIHRFSCALQRVRQDEQIKKGDTHHHHHHHHHPTSSEMIELFVQQEHEISRHCCLQQIARIQSKEACCYLLQNWLLSLVLCDVSFFVTLQQLPPMMDSHGEPIGSSKQNNVAEETCPSKNMATRLLRPQSEDAPGLLELQFHDDVVQEATLAYDQTVGVTRTIAFQYQVNMIDCDKKPSKKLQSRHKKEKVFQYLNKIKFV